MELETVIKEATPEELDVIRRVMGRCDSRPAVVVTIGYERRRYVVDQKDEDEFEGIEDGAFVPDRTHAGTWFGARWLRALGRVDEMHRTLHLGDVVKVQRIDRQRVFTGSSR